MSRRYSKRTRVVAAPVALSSNITQTTGQQNITLRGREFINDVVVSFPGAVGSGPQSSLYNVSNVRISPTDSNLFSWLTPIAEKFEEFKLYGLAFTYEPQCTTNTTGCVGIYYDPDPTNSPPQSWGTFTNTGANSHGATWAKHQLVVPRGLYADRRTYYVPDQYDDAASGTVVVDPLEYYPGSVGVATHGILGEGGEYLTIGKLYLDYVITFSKATIDTVPRRAIKGLGYRDRVSNPPLQVGSVPTGLVSGPSVSPFVAGNSGNGMFFVVNNTGVGPVFGISSAGTVNGGALPFRFGDELWDWGLSVATVGSIIGKSGVVAKQTQDLLYCLCLDGLTAGNVYFRFHNSDGDASTLSGFSQAYYKVVSSGTPGIVACGTIHVLSGERISLEVTNSSGTLSAAHSKFYFAPFTWGLDG